MAIDIDAIHRVCQIMNHEGPCLLCPLTDIIDGEEYQRGCVAVAEEVINVVETGNPWRKTQGVKPPWIVK